MCLQYCSVEGCEIAITDSDRKNWDRAEELGLKGFEGLCLAHMRDRIKRAELAKIKEAKEAPSPNARPLYGSFTCEEGWIRVGEVASLLRTRVARVNRLADQGLLEVKTYDHHSRRAVELGSLKAFVNQIAEGFIFGGDIPNDVFSTIVLHLPEIQAELEELCQDGANE